MSPENMWPPSSASTSVDNYLNIIAGDVTGQLGLLVMAKDQQQAPGALEHVRGVRQHASTSSRAPMRSTSRTRSAAWLARARPAGRRGRAATADGPRARGRCCARRCGRSCWPTTAASTVPRRCMATLDDGGVPGAARDCASTQRRGGARSRRPAASTARWAACWRSSTSAIAEGTWPRLKACRRHTCEWAFYRPHQEPLGRLVQHGVCGNRAKARRTASGARRRRRRRA